MSNKKELESILVNKFEESVHTMLGAFLKETFEEAGMDIKAFGEFMLDEVRDQMIETIDKVFTEEDAAVFVDYNNKLSAKVEEFNKLYSERLTEISETLDDKLESWIDDHMNGNDSPQTVIH